MELLHGAPADKSGRSDREIRAYAFLDRLGIEYDRTDYPDQPATTMEVCAEVDAILGVNEYEKLDRAIRALRAPALKALEESRRFRPPMPIEKIAELAKPFLSLGNQYGEGWFLTGEMAELLTEGVENIVCIQPFACLPNHVVGKGVIKALRRTYPFANIAAVDYDPGASEVNQLNRIKLMLSEAKRRLG